MKRVVVGLSGGVDSSVAAYLLKKQGYDVIGLFMKNWHDDSVTISDECPWLNDSYDAMIVAETLQIPFQTIDLSKQYKRRIVDYMFKEYRCGRTPNPDVLCNREIKFDVFLKIALSLGADYVATGHYCMKKEIIENKEKKKIYRLVAGKDKNKDQSYFLCQISQKQLEKALFPIGALQKTQVREIATEQNLITAKKKDSQGLCFIGKIKLPDFLKQQLASKQGIIVEIPSTHTMYHQPSKEKDILAQCKKYQYQPKDGEEIGKHQGAHFFTIGQRRGLQVGGKEKPVFVIDIDVEKNIIYVGQGNDHPGLFRKALLVQQKEIHWIRTDLQLSSIYGDNTLEVMARIRYRQALQKAKLIQIKEGLVVVFNTPQSAITSGQFVAWYVDNELLGSGVIS